MGIDKQPEQKHIISVGARNKFNPRMRRSASPGLERTYAGLLAVEDSIADGRVGIALAPLQAQHGHARRACRRDPGRSAENSHMALTFWYSDTRNQR
jgi:hypothetical protein